MKGTNRDTHNDSYLKLSAILISVLFIKLQKYTEFKHPLKYPAVQYTLTEMEMDMCCAYVTIIVNLK